MLREISAEQRATEDRYLEVDVEDDNSSMDLWNAWVRVVDADPAMYLGPYYLPSITLLDLTGRLTEWSLLHGRNGEGLPVFFRRMSPKVIPQLLERIRKN